MKLSEIPHKLGNELVKLAYENKDRIEQERKERPDRIRKLMSPTPIQSDPTKVVHNLSATITSDGKTIHVQFDSVQLDILKKDDGRFELKQPS